ncbi:laccase-2-like [Gossypium australe]|uniref:Laccase-2-like n=1 Tax=Gossypium australe TaxID=47621 RepID=A0A5B6WJ07_9ROSI|nr:laccase-2-like [Gossypium australe]
MFVVGLLSRFMHYCNTSHLKAAKRVLRYVKGTVDFGANPLKLICYSDNDWAGSVDDMRSTSEYFFSLGSGVLSWSLKKQSTVAQSTAKAEYVATAVAVNQAIWLRKLLFDLKLVQVEATLFFCDNQSAIMIAKNPVFHVKTKHFEIKCYFVGEVEHSKEVTLIHCSTETQLVGILTKPLGEMRFEELRDKTGVHSMKVKEKCCKMTIRTTCTTGELPRLGILFKFVELFRNNELIKIGE